MTSRGQSENVYNAKKKKEILIVVTLATNIQSVEVSDPKSSSFTRSQRPTTSYFCDAPAARLSAIIRGSFSSFLQEQTFLSSSGAIWLPVPSWRLQPAPALKGAAATNYAFVSECRRGRFHHHWRHISEKQGKYLFDGRREPSALLFSVSRNTKKAKKGEVKNGKKRGEASVSWRIWLHANTVVNFKATLKLL